MGGEVLSGTDLLEQIRMLSAGLLGPPLSKLWSIVQKRSDTKEAYKFCKQVAGEQHSTGNDAPRHNRSGGGCLYASDPQDCMQLDCFYMGGLWHIHGYNLFSRFSRIMILGCLLYTLTLPTNLRV